MAEIFLPKSYSTWHVSFHICLFWGDYLLRVCSRGRPLACSFRNTTFFFVQNPYKPSCATATGRRDNPLFNLTSGSPGLANLAQKAPRKVSPIFVEIDPHFVCESLQGNKTLTGCWLRFNPSEKMRIRQIGWNASPIFGVKNTTYSLSKKNRLHTSKPSRTKWLIGLSFKVFPFPFHVWLSTYTFSWFWW